MERKFGKYAIRNLPAIIVGLYAAGYLLGFIGSKGTSIIPYLTLDPVYILKGEVWRLITWVIIPPFRLDIFLIITLIFYYSIGSAMERQWGAFRFNLFFFMGMFWTVAGAFLLFLYFKVTRMQLVSFGQAFSSYYICMSILFPFAFSFPDAQVLLYLIIPVRMKWIGILYLALIGWSFIQTSLAGKVMILASLLNLLIFWLLTGNSRKGAYRGRNSWGSPFRKSGQNKGSFGRQGPFGGSAGDSARIRPQTRKSPQGNPPAGKSPVHRCYICGRTELDSDQLEFRYCSKCDGAYEYCQDHLFTHAHIHNGQN